MWSLEDADQYFIKRCPVVSGNSSESYRIAFGSGKWGFIGGIDLHQTVCYGQSIWAAYSDYADGTASRNCCRGTNCIVVTEHCLIISNRPQIYTFPPMFCSLEIYFVNLP